MNREPDSGEPPQLRLERVLPAPVEDVFAAWTDPATMARWLSPTGRAEVETDARVGGRFKVVMVGEGMRIEHTGEYLELAPPRRLSFTWRSPYTGDGASVVTVTLTPEGDTTRLVLVHDRLPSGAVDADAGGWSSIIENLAAELHPTRGQAGPTETGPDEAAP